MSKLETKGPPPPPMGRLPPASRGPTAVDLGHDENSQSWGGAWPETAPCFDFIHMPIDIRQLRPWTPEPLNSRPAAAVITARPDHIPANNPFRPTNELCGLSRPPRGSLSISSGGPDRLPALAPPAPSLALNPATGAHKIPVARPAAPA